MTELTPEHRRALRATAHHLRPVVSIAGNGLTPAVVEEIDRSLQAHELIKVKVHGAEREQREALLAGVCEALDAAPVQHIGTILVIWRKRRDEPAPGAAAKIDKLVGNRRPSKAKSASAFASAARLSAMIQSEATRKRRTVRKPGQSAKKPIGRGGA